MSEEYTPTKEDPLHFYKTNAATAPKAAINSPLPVANFFDPPAVTTAAVVVVLGPTGTRVVEIWMGGTTTVGLIDSVPLPPPGTTKGGTTLLALGTTLTPGTDTETETEGATSLLLPPVVGTTTVVVLETVVKVRSVVVVTPPSEEGPLPPPLPPGAGALAEGEEEGEGEGEPEPPTGQTVVLTGTTSVVTWPILPGQLVTVGAHEVMV
jgi:hypothetical protein